MKSLYMFQLAKNQNHFQRVLTIPGQNFMANATKLYRDRFNDNVLVAQRKIRDEIGKML